MSTHREVGNVASLKAPEVNRAALPLAEGSCPSFSACRG